MFCPQCGSQQNDEMKFCKLCGAHLQAVREVVATGEAGEKFDWNKTWLTEMFLSAGERKRREEELERQRGITPEVKRYQEIKAGVITSSVGIGVAIFLFIFMEGIILSGKFPADTAEILRRLWVVGVIPLFVGFGLIINGLFVSRKLVESAGREPNAGSKEIAGEPELHSLPAADTTEFISPGFSATEGTTRHLKVPTGKKEL